MQPWNIIIFCPIDMQFHIYKHHMIQIKNGTATVYGNTKLALIPIFPMLCVCENPEWINRHEKWLLLPGLQTYDGGWSLFIHWKCKYHHCHSAHNAKYEIKAQGLIMRQFLCSTKSHAYRDIWKTGKHVLFAKLIKLSPLYDQRQSVRWIWEAAENRLACILSSCVFR